MKLLLLLLVLVVVGLVVAVAAGSITGGLGDPARSTPDPGLPPGPLRAQDLEQVRFAPALRGYRMDQVDTLLDRLRDQLAVAEEEARRARLAQLVTEAAPVERPAAAGPGPAPAEEPVEEPTDRTADRTTDRTTDQAAAATPREAAGEVLQHPGAAPAGG